MAITFAPVSPTLRVPQLSDRRAELLNAFTFDPKTQNASEFMARFTSMGLMDRLLDCVSAYFHVGSRKKDLLEAIAIHKIAATPGGEAELKKMGKLQELGPSAKYLLSSMTTDARKEMLAKPPVLRDDGQAQMTFTLPGTNGQASIELVLTKGCFEDHGPVGSTLTRAEILCSGWWQTDAEGNKLFLKDLEEKAHKIRGHSSADMVTLGIIMNRVTDARADGNMENCSAQDQALCKLIRKECGLTPRMNNLSSTTLIDNTALEARRARAGDSRMLRAEDWQKYTALREAHRALQEPSQSHQVLQEPSQPFPAFLEAARAREARRPQ